MDYPPLFRAITAHLDRAGITASLVNRLPATGKAIRQAEKSLGVELPAGLREFYRTVGNGFVLSWKAAGRFTALIVPDLDDLVEQYHGWRGLVLYTPEKADEYGFPYTKDPALAKRTAARMWHWLPVIDEGNGDAVCIDLAAPRGPVVFHKHDWMDGGTGDDGHRLADSWPDFLADWGRVCFQAPRGMWWPAVFRAGGGIDWDSDQFDPAYRLGPVA